MVHIMWHGQAWAISHYTPGLTINITSNKQENAHMPHTCCSQHTTELTEYTIYTVYIMMIYVSCWQPDHITKCYQKNVINNKDILTIVPFILLIYSQINI